MNTIKTILDVQPDGTLHLPLPPELQGGKVYVEARLTSAVIPGNGVRFGLLQDLPGPFWISPDFDEPLADFREYME